MNRFWQHVLLGLVRASGARALCEIGTQYGALTEQILGYCHEVGGVLHVVDPEPQFDVDEWRQRYGASLVFHRGLSLEVLPSLGRFDFVFIDGDHNWYTVINELRELERNADLQEQPPPVVALHDVGWPYGRRDLYYDPETIPQANRQPNVLGALHPDQMGIVEGGLNAHLHNAVDEGTEENGVLTAVEDFMRSSNSEWSFAQLPGLHGLGVLAEATRLEKQPHLESEMARIQSPEFLQEHAELIERYRVLAEIRAAEGRRSAQQLEARLAEAERARNELAAQAEQLRGRLDDAEKTIENTNHELGKAGALLEDTRLELQAVGVAAARAEAERDRLEQITVELSEKAAELEAQAESVRARLNASERERAAAAVQIARVDGERAVVEARLDALSDRLSDAAEQRASLSSEIDRLRSEHHAIDRRQRESAVRAARSEAERAALESRLAEVRDDRNVARKELKQAYASSAELGALASRLEARLSELEAAGQQARDHERETRSRFIAQIDGLEERLERELADNETLAAELTDALARPVTPAADDALSARLDAAKVHLASAQSRMERLVDERTPPTREREQESPPGPDPRLTPEPVAKRAVRALEVGPERQAGLAFSARYADLRGATGFAEVTEEDLALPCPVFTEPDGDVWEPFVSVIVCVHNALDDVRRCLASVAAHMTVDAEVIVVNDGSDEPTARLLRQVAQANTRVRLVENLRPPHGYTIAANHGLRRATGEYLVLLNSDTIVSVGWLERILACGEANDRVGILGPLSNAATHQSVPAVREAGAWATNPLPTWLTVDGVSVAVSSVSASERPRVPFVNGFCYALKRAVLDEVGYFDEENFASGYCEENDFSLRARDAGFEAAIVDDAWVYHAKSKSYTPQGRNEHAKRNYAIFLAKHGAERVNALVEELEQQAPSAQIGARLDRALADPWSFVTSVHESLGEPVSPTFVLPGIAKGGSGGSHSIVQEVTALRNLGIPARIAIPTTALARVRDTYPRELEAFAAYLDARELEEITADANVVVATHFRSVELVKRLRSRRANFLACYYIQDYEPFFAEPDTPSAREAHDSYTAIPGSLLFAKTHWLCNIVAAAHRVRVHKVEPSLDTAIYRPAEPRPVRDRPLVVAMVRPRTPRRQPRATLWLLERLLQEFDGAVEVASFGCAQADIDALTDDPELRSSHRGMLSRPDVAALLQQATMFIDMSTYQAFGRTALEAMACGCVPVVPAAGGVWEFAKLDVNAVVTNTQDEERAYAETAALLRERGRLVAMREAGLSTAARYSRERAALSEFALFSGALARLRVQSPKVTRRQA